MIKTLMTYDTKQIDAKNASAPPLGKALSRFQRAELAIVRRDQQKNDISTSKSPASLQRMKTRQRVLSIYQVIHTTITPILINVISGYVDVCVNRKRIQRKHGNTVGNYYGGHW
jgi:hypothetical protein